MRILELHAPYFQALWRRGHDVLAWGSSAGSDLGVPAPVVQLGDILSQLPRGWTPDAILFGDDSRLLRVLGLEHAPCPLVMLSIDAHHHAAWHGLLGSAFDLVFVAQRDYLPAYAAAGVAAPRWLPLWAPDGVPPPAAEKRYAAAFVGNVDPGLHPERAALLAALGARVPLHIATGAWAEVYTQSRIVLNQTVKGDLNFRVFEAMAAGAMLLTERTGNGLLELFTDGEDLVTYPRGDVGAIVTAAERWLAAPGEREAIAARGRARVLAAHLESHRAREVLEAMQGLGGALRPPDVRRAGIARAYCVLALQAQRIAERAPDFYEAYRALCLASAALVAAEADTPEPDRRAVLGHVALQRGELAAAADHLGFAAANGGPPEDHLGLIESCVRGGDLRRARRAAEALHAAHPGYDLGALIVETLADAGAGP